MFYTYSLDINDLKFLCPEYSFEWYSFKQFFYYSAYIQMIPYLEITFHQPEYSFNLGPLYPYAQLRKTFATCTYSTEATHVKWYTMNRSWLGMNIMCMQCGSLRRCIPTHVQQQCGSLRRCIPTHVQNNSAAL